MEKHVGTSAGLLALLAFLIHTLMPPVSEQGKNGAAPKTAAGTYFASNAKGAKPVPEEGPWLASRQYFHQEPPANFESTCIDYLLPPPGRNATCDAMAMSKLFGLGPAFHPRQLKTLIATIPDPLHTRMSLEADRYLDAIQDAAFVAQWELATQWLPWTAKAGQISEGPSAEAAPPRLDLEKMPGLLVFRRSFVTAAQLDALLFVFVVGETPTAGINGFQFEAATRCIDALTGAPRISILGPTFSGSFMSLTKLMEGDGGNRGYDIRAGSVSNSVYAGSMLHRLTPSRSVTFHGSTLPSVSFDAQFKELAQQLGFHRPEIAELVEDDSGFSVGVVAAAPLLDNFKIATYRYPRDIAQLRDAYSDVAFSGGQKAGAAAPQALQFSLKDTQSGESDFPIFSTSHTPVSQNAILEQIVSDLKRQRVRLLSLSATNVFDTLFIANVLAKECPDLRVVVSGADLLFVQEAAQNSLSGILAISPFPMFPKGFEWANGKHEGTTFADADSVGEYNAALALLDGDVKDSLAFEPSFKNDPLSFSSAWLLVLGRHGWAPVDLLDQYNRPLLPGKSGQPEEAWFDTRTKPSLEATRGVISLRLPPAPKGWTILCLLMASLSLAFCGRFAYLRLRPTVRTWSVLCSIDLLPGCNISRAAHARYVCLFGCLASLIFLNGILLLPMANSEVVRWPLQILVLAAFCVPLAAECWLLYRIPASQQSEPTDSVHPLMMRYAYSMLCLRILVLLLPLLGLFFWYQLCFDGTARGTFFRFRVLSLAFPVSPIWPLLLGTLGFFIAAFFHLRRLTWADRQRPLLETSTLDRFLWGQLGEASDALDRVFSAPARTKPGLRLAGLGIIAGVVALLVLLFPEESLRSFERRGYEKMLIALFLPLSMLVMGSFIRFAFSWRILRGLLTALNSLAIARFFGRLPDFDGSGPVWIRDLKLMSLATSVNSAIALHNLKLAMPLSQLDPQDYWKALQAFLSPQPSRDRAQILAQYRLFLQKASQIGQILSESVLQPFWQTHRIAFVQAGSVKEAETAAPLALAATAGGGTQSASMEKEGYEMASQYVALQYAVFIGYALRHIQNLLLCSVLSFVFLVLALNSFSFQAPQAISRLMLIALAAGGVVVVRALAQIERNPVVSRISGNQEGALGKDFYLRVLTYGALPVLTVLGTQFPSIARFLTSWAEPTLEALK